MPVSQDDPIAAIEDRFARAIARTIVHVRRFLTFYAGGLGFAVAMLMMPLVHAGDSGTPASVAGPASAAGAAGPGSRAVATPGRKATTPAGVATASFSTGGDSFLDDDAVGAGAALASGSGGALGDRRAAPLTTPALPDSPDTPDVPSTPDAPELCRLEPPSPAPAVSPERELSGAQDTAEAVAEQQLPADAGETVSPVAQTAMCSTPEAPVDVPSVPLPATPVDASRPSVLQRLVALLF